MRKKVFGWKLGRNRSSRRALFRSLVRALVAQGAIQTTKAKARAIQGEVDKIMRLVAQDTLTAKRRVLAKLGNDQKTVNKLFNDYQSLTKSRKSGFTRIVKLPQRRGDSAQIVRFEWVEKPEVKKPAKPKNEDTTTKSKRH
jgi:large subunit ribosomal protein L17